MPRPPQAPESPPGPRMRRRPQPLDPWARMSLSPYYNDEYRSFYDETESNFRIDEESIRIIDSLPVGFRFLPTDEELIVYFLLPKVEERRLPPSKIVEADVYQHSPMGLAERYKDFGEDSWIFFSPTGQKYGGGKRRNRAARGGFWKSTGMAIEIGYKLGFKRVMVFHLGNPPGRKTNWRMLEYWLDEDYHPPLQRRTIHMRLGEWLLCKIYQRPGPKCKYPASLTTAGRPTSVERAPQTPPSSENYNDDQEVYRLIPVEDGEVPQTPPTSEDSQVSQYILRQPTTSQYSLLDRSVPTSEGLSTVDLLGYMERTHGTHCAESSRESLDPEMLPNWQPDSTASDGYPLSSAFPGDPLNSIQNVQPDGNANGFADHGHRASFPTRFGPERDVPESSQSSHHRQFQWWYREC